MKHQKRKTRIFSFLMVMSLFLTSAPGTGMAENISGETGTIPQETVQSAEETGEQTEKNTEANLTEQEGTSSVENQPETETAENSSSENTGTKSTETVPSEGQPATETAESSTEENADKQEEKDEKAALESNRESEKMEKPLLDSKEDMLEEIEEKAKVIEVSDLASFSEAVNAVTAEDNLTPAYEFEINTTKVRVNGEETNAPAPCTEEGESYVVPQEVFEKDESVNTDEIASADGNVTLNEISEKTDYEMAEQENTVQLIDPFQNKRLIVISQNGFDPMNAVSIIQGYGNVFVVDYETEEDTKAAYEYLQTIPNLSVETDMPLDVQTSSTEKSAELPEQEISKVLQTEKTNPDESEVSVAVIDTGYDQASHVDVRIASSDTEDIQDENGHGTAIINFLLSTTGEKVKFLPIKVAGSDGRTTALKLYIGILKAIENKADLINISMSGKNVSNAELVTQAVEQAEAAGIPVIVSAGNSNEDIASYLPANIASAITVGAVNENREKSTYSNFGEGMDFVTYGSIRYNNVVSGNEENITGTSAAAAAVTGMAANLLTKDKSCDIYAKLLEEVIDIGEPGYDSVYGNGFVGNGFFETDVDADTVEEPEDGIISVNANPADCKFFTKKSYFYVQAYLDGKTPGKNSNTARFKVTFTASENTGLRKSTITITSIDRISKSDYKWSDIDLFAGNPMDASKDNASPAHYYYFNFALKARNYYLDIENKYAEIQEAYTGNNFNILNDDIVKDGYSPALSDTDDAPIVGNGVAGNGKVTFTLDTNQIGITAWYGSLPFTSKITGYKVEKFDSNDWKNLLSWGDDGMYKAECAPTIKIRCTPISRLKFVKEEGTSYYTKKSGDTQKVSASVKNRKASFDAKGGIGCPDITTNRAVSGYAFSKSANSKGKWDSTKTTYTFGSYPGIMDTVTTQYTGSYNVVMPKTTRAGYTLVGWTTDPAGATAQYTAGQSVALTGNTKFYAVWRANTGTIQYHANTGTTKGGYGLNNSIIQSGGKTVTTTFRYTDSRIDLADATAMLNKTGYEIVPGSEWRINSASGSVITQAATTRIDEIKKLIQNGDAVITMYANWQPKVYKITLDNQGADKSETQFVYEKYTTGYYQEKDAKNNFPNHQIKIPEKKVIDNTLLGGYREQQFLGYFTEKGAAGYQMVEKDGSLIANINNAGNYKYFTSDATVYAAWKDMDAIQFSPNLTEEDMEIISKDAEGNRITDTHYCPDTVWKAKGESITVQYDPAYVKNESFKDIYRFKGWSLTPEIASEDEIILSEEKTSYTFSADEDVTLYAQWDTSFYVTYVGNEQSEGMDYLDGVDDVKDAYTFSPNDEEEVALLQNDTADYFVKTVEKPTIDIETGKPTDENGNPCMETVPYSFLGWSMFSDKHKQNYNLWANYDVDYTEQKSNSIILTGEKVAQFEPGKGLTFGTPVEDYGSYNAAHDSSNLIAGMKGKPVDEYTMMDVVQNYAAEVTKTPFVNMYAIWDQYPQIEICDLYYTLNDAQAGILTEEYLLNEAVATDEELKSSSNLDGRMKNGEDAENHTSFTIPDYQASDFTWAENDMSMTLIYQAIDSVGNVTKKMVTVHLVDTTAEPYDPGYVRFISKEYIDTLDENSIWRTNPEYAAKLEYVLNNYKHDEEYTDPTPFERFLGIKPVKKPGSGTWDHVQQVWVFSHEEVLEVQDYVETYGMIDSQEGFLQKFGHCRVQ